ncbi:iron ABC transporter permease [Ignatzschineria indica]|uniref:FecCD family ABC transporter permease n=1 Tax=Ignatzschineria indica TaxID=472583 RepID=UPI002576111D|nr:iron ABC transporter permease [Ignatzschineria indica]MDM1545071.1 iron ABC transporter permease [Ignatzschineria indica]
MAQLSEITKIDKRIKDKLLYLGGMSLIFLMIMPSFGLTFLLPWGEGAELYWQLRFPRAVATWLIGAGLALAGLVLQAILRNPLAEPFTLGVAAGASLGAAIYIYWGISFSLGIMTGLTIFSFIGALIVTIIIYQVNFRTGHSPIKLLLMGVILTFFISSILMLLQALGRSSSALAMMSWMMGRLSLISLNDLWQLLLITAFSSIIIFRSLIPLNLLQQGHEVALSRGVDSVRVMQILFLVVSLMTALFVAIAGPIGFVGMVVPHLIKRILGSSDHRYLFWGVIFMGGGLLVVADTIGSLILRPSEIPVGVITALLGAPFFLYLLLKGGHRDRFVKASRNKRGS